MTTKVKVVRPDIDQGWAWVVMVAVYMVGLCACRSLKVFENPHFRVATLFQNQQINYKVLTNYQPIEGLLFEVLQDRL